MRLICFPHAGGIAAVFARWAIALAPIRVVGVRLAGRGSRFNEPALRTVPAIVDSTFGQVVDALQGEEPFILYGHSFGALLAFETARQLQRQKLPSPRLLIVSGRGAPHLATSCEGVPVYRLPNEELLEHLAAMGGTPRAVLSDEYADLILPCIRADLEASETYQFQNDLPLSCPITVFGGTEDHGLRRADLAGWTRHTVANCSVRLLPGGHFFPFETNSRMLHHIAAEIGARDLPHARRAG